MNESFFASVAPDILKWGEELSQDERVNIAKAVAKWACINAGETELSVRASTDRTYLWNLSEGYDDRYFSIYEENDDQLDEAGLALSWFRKARAVSALLHSLDAAVGKHFFSTLSEAQAAVGGVDELRNYLRAWMPDAQ